MKKKKRGGVRARCILKAVPLLATAAVSLASADAEAVCGLPSAVWTYPNGTTGVYQTPQSQRASEAATGDDFYDQWICDAGFSSEHWSRYAMDKEDWDNGRGYDNYCNVTRMLGRTYIAYWVLDWSSPTPATTWDDFSGNALKWAGNYSAREIDELDGVCAWGKFGYTKWGALIDNYTEVWLDFAYNLPAASRATTILHEARHADGWGSAEHNGNDTDDGPPCLARDTGCDEIYSDTWSGRANSIQLWFMTWYNAQAVNTTTFQKNWMRVRGNWILDNRFDTDPGWNY